MKLPTQISVNEAIMLQQIQEDGEDDVLDLSSQLDLPKSSVFAIIKRLKNKGLIEINNQFGELLVSLTRRGQQFIKSAWPETNRHAVAF